MKKISAQTVIHKLQNTLFQINMEKVNNLLDRQNTQGLNG